MKGRDGRRRERQNELNNSVQFRRIADQFLRCLLVLLQFFAQTDDRIEIKSGEIRQFDIVQDQIEEPFEEDAFVFAMKNSTRKEK